MNRLKEELVKMSALVKCTSLIVDKVNHLCQLHEEGVLQHSSAIDHFKHWLQDYKKTVDKLKELNEKCIEAYLDHGYEGAGRPHSTNTMSDKQREATRGMDYHSLNHDDLNDSEWGFRNQ